MGPARQPTHLPAAPPPLVSWRGVGAERERKRVVAKGAYVRGSALRPHGQMANWGTWSPALFWRGQGVAVCVPVTAGAPSPPTERTQGRTVCTGRKEGAAAESLHSTAQHRSFTK